MGTAHTRRWNTLRCRYRQPGDRHVRESQHRMAAGPSPSPVCSSAGTMERRVSPIMTLPRCRSSPSRWSLCCRAHFAAGSGGTETSSVHAYHDQYRQRHNRTRPERERWADRPAATPRDKVAPNILWPNGFNAFNCMKYEVSQQGYVDFLNTLTYDPASNTHDQCTEAPLLERALWSPATLIAVAIDIQTPGVASTTPAVYACNLNGDAVYSEAVDGKDLGCNFMSWGDLSSLSGLERPTADDRTGVRKGLPRDDRRCCQRVRCGEQLSVADQRVYMKRCRHPQRGHRHQLRHHARQCQLRHATVGVHRWSGAGGHFRSEWKQQRQA
jgi:hypothetical protein